MSVTEAPVRAALGAVSPFFVVGDLWAAMGFYRDVLGFEVTYAGPDPEPFFATVRRDGVQFLLKVVGDGVAALPNRQRHPDARWDARHNPGTAGRSTGWAPVLGVIAALMIGATALMATIAFGGQRYFEWQVEEARRISA